MDGIDVLELDLSGFVAVKFSKQ